MDKVNSKYLSRLGIEELNEMQTATAKALANNDDVILLSPTGSGKTVAFLLPLIKHLSDVDYVQTLILVPSRELALQIESVFKMMQTGYKITCCYGGHSIKVETNNLNESPAVIVGTPGRVDDLLKRRILSLSKVTTIVLDEFDKSLEMGFKEEMSYIMDKMLSLERKILTSATNIEELPDFVGIKNPYYLNFLKEIKTNDKLRVKKVFFGVDNVQVEGQKNVDDTDSEGFKEVNKFQTINRLLGKHDGESILVFFNHRDAVKRVSKFLKSINVVHELFHGELKQDDRERTLAKFRNGTCKILLSTDLAARGLDIPEIDCVIHYHLPISEQAYTHRNGRTARMNANGMAYILVPEDNKVLPLFIPKDLETIELSAVKPDLSNPEWETLYISKGKKDKINKIDVVGFLSQKGKLKKDEIGLIEVKDFHCYVAIKKSKTNEVLKLIQNEKIKNIKAKIEVAR